jgi:hypothetical protein
MIQLLLWSNAVDTVPRGKAEPIGWQSDNYRFNVVISRRVGLLLGTFLD